MQTTKKKQRIGVRFEDPIALYERSEYTLCVSYLGTADDPGSYLLKQRCLLRLGQYSELIQPGALSHIARFPERDRFNALVHLGAAYFRRDMRVPADRAFHDAHELADKLSLSTADRAPLYYYEGSRLWAAHDFDSAERLFLKVAAVDETRALGLTALSWIAAARGDLRQQLQYIDETLDNTTEPYLLGNSLHSGTHLACELFDEARIDRYKRLAKDLTWSTDTTIAEFYTFRSLGWCAMLRGQNFDAHDYFERAMKTALRNQACQTMIGSDRAHLAMVIRDKDARNRLMTEAYTRIGSVRWADANAERTALLNISVLYAMSGLPQVSSECWEKYCDISTRIDPALAFGNGDQRLRALEKYTEGWVHCTSDRVEVGIQCFREAFRIWNQIGYHWRATLVALALKKFGRYRTLDEFIERRVDGSFKDAWFAREIQTYRDRASHPVIKALTPRLREIVLLLLDGFSNDEIAEALELSSKTVRNRLSDVYEQFQASGRAKLRMKLNELGVK